MIRHWVVCGVFSAALGGCATQQTEWLVDKKTGASPASPAQVQAPAPTTASPVYAQPTPAVPVQYETYPEISTDAAATTRPAPQPAYRVETVAVQPAVPAPRPVYIPAALPAQTTAPAPVRPAALDPVPVPSRIAPSSARTPRAIGPRPTGVYLAKLENQGSAPEGSYGYILIDANDGTVLAERNADTPLAPASMVKLLAAVAILETKGANGTFRTTVHADGPISGGVLNGNLHLVGSGDPSLLSSDLRRLAGQLASAGITRVNGRFYYHPDAIPQVPSIDPAQGRGVLYNPGIGGLNLDHNEKGGVAPVSNPGRYTATAFRQFARSAGVSLPDPQRASGAVRGTVIAAHESQPVSTILVEMFNVSRNMTAEVLGAVAATELGRKPGSIREAAQINANWIQGQTGAIGGAGWSGFDFPNHSGLSTRSRATVRQMAEIARYGHRRFGMDFSRLYDVRAMTGTSGGVTYDIRSKIGTMRYVRGLAGLMNVGGREMVFAIMAMDPARRAGNPESWMSKARKLERALMTDWIQDMKPGGPRTAGL